MLPSGSMELAALKATKRGAFPAEGLRVKVATGGWFAAAMRLIVRSPVMRTTTEPQKSKNNPSFHRRKSYPNHSPETRFIPEYMAQYFAGLLVQRNVTFAPFFAEIQKGIHSFLSDENPTVYAHGASDSARRAFCTPLPERKA